MNNDTQQKLARAAFQNRTGTENETKRRRAYQRPEVVTYDSATIIRALGPAHGVYGTVDGLDQSL